MLDQQNRLKNYDFGDQASLGNNFSLIHETSLSELSY